MRISRTRSARPGGIAAAVLLGAAVAVLVPTPAHAATATFASEGQWSGGYVGKMTVHNDASTALTAWRVEFDLPAGTTVAQHWHATLSRFGDRYVFTNLGWNGQLAPGATASFGWLATGGGAPTGCTVNGAPCAGVRDPGSVDIRPPSTPTNLRTGVGPQPGLMSLSWDPSTDDRGVTGYEVYLNERRIATTTTLSHTMPIPPPFVTHFGVRAVDAAGNLSPFVVLPMAGLQDTTPPTAPTNLYIGGPGSGYLTVGWTAARDDVMVAGYRVYVNNELVRTVGGTSARVPWRGFGVYSFAVYAFDGAGNLSGATAIAIAIDGPPPSPSPSPQPSPPVTGR